jgi:hypothetical protein
MAPAMVRTTAYGSWVAGLLALATLVSEAEARTFTIQQARDEKYFIINESHFEARRSACRFFEEGQSVIFITGDPEARCLTAVIQNLNNGQSCELWCREQPYQR